MSKQILSTTHSLPGASTTRDLQWALLCAHARSLPIGWERVSVRTQAALLLPPLGERGRALAQARELGLLKQSRLTPAGCALVRQWRSKTTSLSQELPMTNAVPQSDPLAVLVADLVAFYDRTLALPEVQAAPNVEHIKALREVLLGSEDESLSRGHVFTLLIAQRHRSEGITAEELGLPVPLEQAEATQLLLKQMGEQLMPHAEDHSSEVQRVVSGMAAGKGPTSQREFALALALIGYVGKLQELVQQANKAVRAKA